MNSSGPSGEPIGVNDLRDLIGELRMMARRFLHYEKAHSFTPTALAMTALRRAKLTEQDWSDVRWENRNHFFFSMGTAMRHPLVDHARRKNAKGRDRVLYFSPTEAVFNDLPSEAEERPEQFIMLEEALARLEAEDAELAALLQQFYFLGYTVPEIATVSGISEKTVDRNLKKARTLLQKMLQGLGLPTGK